MADLAILVPMLGRAHRVEPLLESIAAATPDADVLFLLSPDDQDVEAAVKAAGARFEVVPTHPVGDYARKINAGLHATTTPHLFLGADDLHFHPGWYERAFRRMTDRIGVVGTNDLGNRRVQRGFHATHSLVARWYAEEHGTIDEPGKILHEGYPHEYVDDELVGTAQRRRAWAMALDSHVEHLHPSYGKAPTDAMYDKQAERMRAGRDLFRRRRRLWT